MLYICSKLFGMAMLVLQECISKLGAFKQAFGKQFGITKLGIFGSVARQENTEDSDIDIVVEVEKPTLSLIPAAICPNSLLSVPSRHLASTASFSPPTIPMCAWLI